MGKRYQELNDRLERDTLHARRTGSRYPGTRSTNRGNALTLGATYRILSLRLEKAYPRLPYALREDACHFKQLGAVVCGSASEPKEQGNQFRLTPIAPLNTRSLLPFYLRLQDR
jgi:hypothetical protein